MKRLVSCGLSVSSLCTSPIEPSVATPRTCVSPLVKRPLPWARGRSPISQSSSRISFRPLPSGLLPSLIILARNSRSRRISKASDTSETSKSVRFSTASSFSELIRLAWSDFPLLSSNALLSLSPIKFVTC